MAEQSQLSFQSEVGEQYRAVRVVAARPNFVLTKNLAGETKETEL
jgi:hypothetical protein